MLREWLLLKGGKRGGGGKGQTVSKNSGETIYSKDFEVVKKLEIPHG